MTLSPTPVEAAPPRWRFVPGDLDAGSLGALETWFERLLARPLPDTASLERWLEDESELMSRVSAELARRYVAMTCHTDDPAAKERYLTFERDVMPRVKVLGDQLDAKFLASPGLPGLDLRRYAVLVRKRRSAKEIFRPQNVPLQTEEAEVQTRQQALMGSLTVHFQGKEHTLQQMAVYGEDQDRGLRERAYRASLDTRRRAWPELLEIYDRLVRLRTTIAANAGFPDYVPYRFRELQRFDYDAATCRRFHDAIAEAVVPAVERCNAARRARLGLPALRPWDLEVDPDGAPPPRPFATEPELIALASRLFARVDPRFAGEFQILVQNRLLDLMSRKGKAPGGYQYTLEDVRLPFVFANSVGLHHDLQTLLHEGGHAFHAILSRDEPLLAYREAPIEFAETASMSMELMGLEHAEEVYPRETARRVRRKHLEGLLRIFPWIASIDSFQLWVYEHPHADAAARCRAWVDIRARFAPGIDWSGLEDALAHSWTAQMHLFVHPLYYIEYGIAQVAALQVWRSYRHGPRDAVAAYRRGLALGGTRPLPELFAAAGVRFDLSPNMLHELVAEVEAAMA